MRARTGAQPSCLNLAHDKHVPAAARPRSEAVVYTSEIPFFPEAVFFNRTRPKARCWCGGALLHAHMAAARQALEPGYRRWEAVVLSCESFGQVAGRITPLHTVQQTWGHGLL